MPRLQRLAWLFVAAVLAQGSTCAGLSSSEIGRERAIEIARPQVSFLPDGIEARRTTSDSHPVWRITFRGRLPGQPPGLFETTVIDVNRLSGEIVSIARN